MAMATADGKHCQGLVCRTRSPRGTYYLDYRFGPPPSGEERTKDSRAPRFGRSAYDAPLCKWTTTWHESQDLKMSGKYSSKMIWSRVYFIP